MPHIYRPSGSSAEGVGINAGASRYGSKVLYISTVMLDTSLLGCNKTSYSFTIGKLFNKELQLCIT